MEHAIAQKDSAIARLQNEIQPLIEKSTRLEGELEATKSELDTARIALEAERRRSDDLEEGIGKAYFLMRTKKDLRQLERLSVLIERRGFYSPLRALSNPSVRAQYFQEIDLKQNEIVLGSGFREARVVSAHKQHPELFQQRKRGLDTILSFDDPLAFWAISHYLVVRIIP